MTSVTDQALVRIVKNPQAARRARRAQWVIGDASLAAWCWLEGHGGMVVCCSHASAPAATTARSQMGACTATCDRPTRRWPSTRRRSGSAAAQCQALSPRAVFAWQPGSARRCACSSLGAPPEQIVAAQDEDKDGKITMDEWVRGGGY